MRMVRALRAELGTERGTVSRVARQLGYGVESVRSWVRQADIDDGYAPGVSTADSARIKRLEQENRELKRANEILKRAASFFGAGARSPTQEIVDFVDTHRDEFGVEPICTVLRSAGVSMAPSTYYDAKTRASSARAQRDAVLVPVLRQLWEDNYSVYGVRKLWETARRVGHDVGRDQVARLMRAAGIQGARRGAVAEVDARSYARPDPTHTVRHHRGVVFNFDPSPGLYSELDWRVGPPVGALPYLTLRLTGVAGLTVDVARAGLAALPSSTITVATDAAAHITLAGLPAGVEVQLDGRPAGPTVAVSPGRHRIALRVDE